jgi:hypothetical protein
MLKQHPRANEQILTMATHGHEVQQRANVDECNSPPLG